MLSYTACYTRNETGYTGQLLEWPEVITEGGTVEECRMMLEDAVREMAAAYKEDNLPIPRSRALFESISIPDETPQYVG